MKTNFKNTAIALAKALAKPYGVEVVIHGDQAYTDARGRIVLPDLGADLDEKTQVILTGYVIHEAAHTRYTNPTVIREAAEKSPEILQCFKFVEDLRIEAAAGREFAGAGRILGRLNQSLFSSSSDLLNGLMLCGFQQVCGQEFATPDAAPVLEVFGEDVFHRIGACDSTASVLRLAEELVERLRAAPDPRAAEVLRQLRVQALKDKAERLSDRLAESHRKRRDRGDYLVYSTTEDEIRTAPEGNVAAFDHLLGSLGAGLNAARQRLINLFRSEAAVRWQGGREQGRIDCRALTRLLVSNDARIFKEKLPNPHINTAVTLLLDCSGSMPQNNRLQAAFASVVLLSEAIRKIPGITLEILGYTTNGGFALTKEEAECYGRIHKLLTYVFKAFDEPWSFRIKKRIAGYKRLHYESNCDADSLRIAVERLIVRHEPRKVLFVITDSLVVSGKAGERELKRLAGEIERDGRIELLVLDIQSGEAKKYYSNVVEITDPEDLPAQLLEGLRTHVFTSLLGAHRTKEASSC